MDVFIGLLLLMLTRIFLQVPVDGVVLILGQRIIAVREIPFVLYRMWNNAELNDYTVETSQCGVSTFC